MTAVTLRSELRFILNGKDVALSSVAPDETLLDWLRLYRSLRGTKEGCAEGDCGACTVLVGRLTVSEGLVYESVNACIRFMGSLDGCHVVTVEHLAGRDGKLHPVQQAMVDHHGSQCGFCTPGVVISLYGLWMQTPKPSDRQIEISLQGNLCRCTGYEPILRAARAISGYGSTAKDPLLAERASMITRLLALRDSARLEIESSRGKLVVPANLDDFAVVLEAQPGATIVAGSTDVGLWVTKHMRQISPVIFVNGLNELKTISVRDGVISIGAGVTYNEAMETLSHHIPSLGALLNRIGGQQVRNMGTIGGNIANGSPIGDMPPPLIALGAKLTLRSSVARRTIALQEFFVAYGKQDRKTGEFLEAVHVPIPTAEEVFAVYKVTKRRDEDISAALAAFRLRLSEGTVAAITIAYGGMAGTPKRAFAVEEALIGELWNEATVKLAMAGYGDDYAPLSDMRATAEYRSLVAKHLLLRFYLETTSGTKTTQVSRNEAV